MYLDKEEEDKEGREMDTGHGDENKTPKMWGCKGDAVKPASPSIIATA